MFIRLLIVAFVFFSTSVLSDEGDIRRSLAKPLKARCPSFKSKKGSLVSDVGYAIGFSEDNSKFAALVDYANGAISGTRFLILNLADGSVDEMDLVDGDANDSAAHRQKIKAKLEELKIAPSRLTLNRGYVLSPDKKRKVIVRSKLRESIESEWDCQLEFSSSK